MKLCNWLQANGMSVNAFAERVGCSPHTIARAVRGESVKPTLAKEIAVITGHEVDLLSLIYPGEDLAVVIRFPTRPGEVQADEVA